MHAPAWTPALAPATAVAVWLIRTYAPWIRHRLPPWSLPLLSAVLGALAAHFGLDAGAGEGALMGLAGVGVYEAQHQARKARRGPSKPLTDSAEKAALQ